MYVIGVKLYAVKLEIFTNFAPLLSSWMKFLSWDIFYPMKIILWQCLPGEHCNEKIAGLGEIIFVQRNLLAIEQFCMSSCNLPL